MRVLKFGGTSVGSAEAIARVKDIVASLKDEAVVIVVSALGGVTDRLIRMANMACEGDEACISELQLIINTHEELINNLFESEKAAEVRALVSSEIEELDTLVKGVFLIRELSRKSLDRISGMGERLSSRIIASYLGANWYDSRNYIKTSFEFGRNQVVYEKSEQLLSKLKGSLGRLSLFPVLSAAMERGRAQLSAGVVRIIQHRC